jgi:hypothetical protein
VEKSTSLGKQAKQFTRDDIARIVACTVNTVLEKLAIQQIVQGIAVFPAGKDEFLVDIVIRDRTTQEDTWGVSVTILPAEEQPMDSLDRSRTYAVLTISRLYLSSLGLTTEQINRLTDEDMQRIADILQAQRFDHEYDEDVTFTARIVLAEKTAHPLSDQYYQTKDTEE